MLPLAGSTLMIGSINLAMGFAVPCDSITSSPARMPGRSTSISMATGRRGSGSPSRRSATEAGCVTGLSASGRTTWSLSGWRTRRFSRLDTPASIYAIGGVTFVSDIPERRARQWRDLLAPAEPFLDDQVGFALGTHRLRWLDPTQFERERERSWQPAPHAYGELAMLHLLAEDLDRVEAQIRQAGLPITHLWGEDAGEPTLLFGPGTRDDFVFAITRYPVAQWAEERRARTGEEFELATGVTSNPDST